MENIGNNAAIISCGVGGWYGQGVRRLERSLIYHGFAGKIFCWVDEYPPNSPTHQDNPYGFKIAAIREAIGQGYRTFLWLDSSVWCTKTPHQIFDLTIDNGVFGFRTGYNLAQTCSDAALSWAGITRDEAEQLPEIASGVCGLHLDNPNAAKVWELWAEGCDHGLFKNNRLHDLNDSADPRFLHARQDQSLWSLAIHKAGVNIDFQDYVSYYGTGCNEEKLIFYIGGL